MSQARLESGLASVFLHVFPWAAVAVLGTLTVPSPVMLLEDDAAASASLVPLPESSEASVRTLAAVQPVAVKQLFKYGFEHIYKFHDVRHVCEVSEEAISNAIADDEGADDDDFAGLEDWAGAFADSSCRQVSIAGDPLRLCFMLQQFNAFDNFPEAISRGACGFFSPRFPMPRTQIWIPIAT